MFEPKTHLSNYNQQASLCVICDCLIVVAENMHQLKNNHILENELRFSIKTYYGLYGKLLHPILADQYCVHELLGILLFLRSFCVGKSFECCSSCNESLKPSKAKYTGSKPPKHAVKNRFAIGHIPSTLLIDQEGDPRQKCLENKHISNIMCASISCQCPCGLIFAFMGSAHQSMISQISFFEMDKGHIYGVIK